MDLIIARCCRTGAAARQAASGGRAGTGWGAVGSLLGSFLGWFLVYFVEHAGLGRFVSYILTCRPRFPLGGGGDRCHRPAMGRRRVRRFETDGGCKVLRRRGWQFGFGRASEGAQWVRCWVRFLVVFWCILLNILGFMGSLLNSHLQATVSLSEGRRPVSRPAMGRRRVRRFETDGGCKVLRRRGLAVWIWAGFRGGTAGSLLGSFLGCFWCILLNILGFMGSLLNSHLQATVALSEGRRPGSPPCHGVTPRQMV